VAARATVRVDTGDEEAAVDWWVWVILAVIVLVVLLALAVVVQRRRRRGRVIGLRGGDE